MLYKGGFTQCLREDEVCAEPSHPGSVLAGLFHTQNINCTVEGLVLPHYPSRCMNHSHKACIYSEAH